MYHFLHRHRYWFVALIVLTVVALAYFQFLDDGALGPGPVEQPQSFVDGP